MTATGRSLSLCLALAVLAGCDQDTPRRNLVVGPTPLLTPPPPPPIDVRDIDRRFDDRFWRQLVFNQYDGHRTRSLVLDATSPNVYIRMGDPTGRRVVSYQQRDHMQRAVPRLVSQLTGSAYRGRVESGIEDRTRLGWITVRFVTQEEEPEIAEAACGRAKVGADPGSIWIVRRARGRRACISEAGFAPVFAHEIGHALGFFHVENRAAVMHPGFGGARTFTATEKYHALLALRGGPGAHVLRLAVPAGLCHAPSRPGARCRPHRHRLAPMGVFPLLKSLLPVVVAFLLPTTDTLDHRRVGNGTHRHGLFQEPMEELPAMA